MMTKMMRSSVSTVREGWEEELLVGGVGRRRVKMTGKIWALSIGLGWKREQCLFELYVCSSLGEAVGGRGQGMTVS